MSLFHREVAICNEVKKMKLMLICCLRVLMKKIIPHVSYRPYHMNHVTWSIWYGLTKKLKNGLQKINHNNKMFFHLLPFDHHHRVELYFLLNDPNMIIYLNKVLKQWFKKKRVRSQQTIRTRLFLTQPEWTVVESLFNPNSGPQRSMCIIKM